MKPGIEYDLDRKTVTNIKFYVAMLIGIKLAGGVEDIVNRLAALPSIIITDSILLTVLDKVLKKYNELGATDQVAKGSGLVSALIDEESPHAASM